MLVNCLLLPRSFSTQFNTKPFIHVLVTVSFSSFYSTFFVVVILPCFSNESPIKIWLLLKDVWNKNRNKRWTKKEANIRWSLWWETLVFLSIDLYAFKKLGKYSKMMKNSENVPLESVFNSLIILGWRVYSRYKIWWDGKNGCGKVDVAHIYSHY